jgi:FkbM family methyltransferase
MNLRLSVLRMLYSMPRFRGRDRAIGILSDGFVKSPTTLPNDGLRMFLDASEYTQLEILVRGSTEPLTLALIRKLIAPGDTVVDVGAHIGHHALVAAQRTGAQGRVIAVDPQPYNADRVSRHAALNGFTNVTTICAAAGASESFVKLPVQSSRDRTRLSLREAGPNDLAVSVEVPLRRLDAIFASHCIGPIKLLKIDVEGYELEVLQGCGDKISLCQNIILELLPETGATRNAELITLLLAHDFRLFDVLGTPFTLGTRIPESNVWARADRKI